MNLLSTLIELLSASWTSHRLDLVVVISCSFSLWAEFCQWREEKTACGGWKSVFASSSKSLVSPASLITILQQNNRKVYEKIVRWNNFVFKWLFSMLIICLLLLLWHEKWLYLMYVSWCCWSTKDRNKDNQIRMVKKQ